ncbi:MAG: LOG family protein [Candidatus Pacebacteria bacterium]|nr:LOG family protein [Candidatus Paceibacterota bacterium]
MAKKRITRSKLSELGKTYLRYKVCISGAADLKFAAPGTKEKAIEVGRLVAEAGAVLVTGATTGVPYWAAKGAKEAGGIVIGLSPAVSKAAHVKTYHLPLEYHDLIIYTGFDYSGRNLLLTRSADAVITIYGRVGTLNEFTIAFEDKKPQGVLTGTGGESDELKRILEIAHRGMGKVIFDPDPKVLVEKVLARVRADEKGITAKDAKVSAHRANG